MSATYARDKSNTSAFDCRAREFRHTLNRCELVAPRDIFVMLRDKFAGSGDFDEGELS